jgi:hypothetical protein
VSSSDIVKENISHLKNRTHESFILFSHKTLPPLLICIAYRYNYPSLINQSQDLNETIKQNQRNVTLPRALGFGTRAFLPNKDFISINLLLTR